MKLKVVALFSALLALSLAGEARASGSFDIGYTTFTQSGIFCTTGTVVQINLTRPDGFAAVPVGYRIQNQDSADSVWLGKVDVTTHTSTAANLLDLGEKLVAGADTTFQVGIDHRNTGARVPIYCRAADAAGAAAVLLSVLWFGF